MAKKAKKRGVKPGTKRGPYRRNKPVIFKYDVPQYQEKFLKEFEAGDAKIGEQLRIRLPKDFTVTDTVPMSVGNLPSLISDLASTVDELEAQLTAQIGRIKSILQ